MWRRHLEKKYLQFETESLSYNTSYDASKHTVDSASHSKTLLELMINHSNVLLFGL